MSIITETDRLIIRHLTAEDEEQLVDILGHPEVMRYSLKGPMSRDEVSEWLAPRLDASAAGEPVQYAVVRKLDESFVGFSGYISFADPDGEADYELGYRFHPACWGGGMATEAARAVLVYGFDHFDLDTVAAIVDRKHAASMRVLEKVGMRYTGDIMYHDILVMRFVLRSGELRML